MSQGIPEKECVTQISLPFSHDEKSLKEVLCRAAGKEISLTITNNSASMISVRPNNNILLVRVHRMFLQAGQDVIDEIAGLMKKRKSKTPHVRRFIKEQSGLISHRRPGPLKLNTEGKYHNIITLSQSVNHEYFNNRIASYITWGKRNPRVRVRRRILGSYHRATDTIRINPVLDSKEVPSCFIEYIIYHEMLHADMGIQEQNGRRTIHSKEFRKREKLFREYEKAIQWEKEIYSGGLGP